MAESNIKGLVVENDEQGMALALTMAKQAYEQGEVPVGAVVVKDGVVIGAGFNQPIISCDPTSHAEVVALRDASAHLSNYRLSGAVLYVTLEPCTMCLGALIHARIDRLVYGASEPKAGAVCSALQLLDEACFNHTVRVQGGVLKEPCSALMSEFFAMRRAQKRQQKQPTN